jgi:hypothetical protein
VLGADFIGSPADTMRIVVKTARAAKRSVRFMSFDFLVAAADRRNWITTLYTPQPLITLTKDLHCIGWMLAKNCRACSKHGLLDCACGEPDTSWRCR